jgi:hypothetical protein
MSPTPEYLEKFRARLADDPLKQDLELTCDECGRAVCNIQPGEILAVLVTLAHNHVCDGPRIERLKREKKEGK